MSAAAFRYANTQNETASKERLMVLLFEAALRHIRTGAQALEARRARDAFNPLMRASDIVTELLTTLDRSKAPELCERLADLYGFVNGRLLRAVATQDATPAREAERVWKPLVDGFRGAVASLQPQTGAAAPR